MSGRNIKVRSKKIRTKVDIIPLIKSTICPHLLEGREWGGGTEYFFKVVRMIGTRWTQLMLHLFNNSKQANQTSLMAHVPERKCFFFLIYRS